MGLRTIGIWLTTIGVCTLGSAAVAAIPLLNADSHNCMLPGNRVAYVLGFIFGCGGFLVSLLLSPVVVESDKLIREHWVEVGGREKQAHSNSLSLLRASELPRTQAKAELLRPAQAGSTTAPEQLLRAVDTEGPEA